MKTKHKNPATSILCFVMAICAATAFTGCGNTNNGADSEQTADGASASDEAVQAGEVYQFEAEYVDLTDKAGAGPSNAAMETELVLADANASNGYYIGYTYFADLYFDFNITADADGEANLEIVMASDLGAVSIGPSVFEISVNDTIISYDEFKLSDSSGKINKVFGTYTISKVNLVAGENKITLKILSNELYNGGTGGPLIDCIILETPAVLSWSPVTSNVNK